MEQKPLENKVTKLGLTRDSESEELNVPLQRSAFDSNAFFYNFHTFMKENIEGLKMQVVKDSLIQTHQVGNSKRKDTRSSIFTHDDLEQFCDNLIFEQFKADIAKDQDNQIESSSSSPASGNILKINDYLDMALSEILCSKASMMLRKIT